ncbi:MAG: hypothetical protein FJ278_22565, partial [Planctomycetes bacterium]|nr:hypothetical protein [Planctomycetota bacterium]
MPNGYRHIPRTMQKLWRGEPLHILHLGYSSDAGDGNPPFYLYDEDSQSPTFKQPLQIEFDGSKVGHPEWTDYIWRWPRYFMAMGRLRCALLRKFDLPVNKILLNTLACSGSFMAEAHPAFADYAALAIPPGPANGHREGKTWRELYPEIFARPEGPGPDLVTIGYGKVYCPQGVDEVEQFEGAIRWFQRRYPHAEFILCPNDHLEGFVGNVGAMRELSLRYGIPFVDFGRAFHLSTRHAGFLQPLSGDAHPQAYMHFLWFKQLERLFEAADPIEPGIPQAHLPERISPFSLGWEGDGRTYTDSDPRIRRGAGFILDDTVVHVWASCKDKKVQVSVDGKLVPEDRCIPRTQRDTRHATFAGGRFSLGDRHIVEVGGTEARMFAVDAKTIPDRQWMGVESPRWSKAEPKTRRGGRLGALR